MGRTSLSVRARHGAVKLIRNNALGKTALGRTALGRTALGAALVCVSPALLYAQDAQQSQPATQEAQGATQVEELVVTASRVARSGFNAPTPTTMVNLEDMQLGGRASIAESLNDVPSFVGSSTPATGTLSSQSPGGNFLNLRGLGPNRTLVLVDRRRHVPTTELGLVDLSVIPSALIERVDVVTGGASAAWGSDAVAGVVNLVFDKKLEGIKVDLQGGASSHGDGESYKGSLAGGTSFADGRGHFIAAVEASDNKGVLSQNDRDWGRKGYQLIGAPAGSPYQQIVGRDVRLGIVSEGGLILSGSNAGKQFLPDGSLAPFQPFDGAFAREGGDGVYAGKFPALSVPVERQNIFTRTTWNFTDDVQGFVELSYARAQSSVKLVQPFDFGTIEIAPDNAYLAQVGLPAEGFAMGRLSTDMGFFTTDVENKTKRGAVGLEGQFGDGWSWDVYYQRGETRYDAKLYNNRIEARYAQSLDAVRDPLTNEIVCRSTLTNPGNGCVPVNVFGYGAPSRDATNWFLGTQSLNQKITQDAAGASIQGEPFSVPAGAVSIATGLEYRKESIDATVDPISAASGFAIGNPKPISGSYDVKEAFLETVVPLLRDLPAVEQLDLNAAVRLTDYSTSGNVTTWKGGLTYKINDQLQFRATRSRDIRAPNLDELYRSEQLRFTSVTDPERTNQLTQIQIITGGNQALQPEEADTFTAGIVFTPSWLEGLRTSLDVYSIKLKGAIDTLTPQDIVNRCYLQNETSLCPQVVRGGDGTIDQVRATFLNLSQRKTQGADLEMSYSLPVGSGDLTVRALATYVDEFITDGVDRAGDVGSDLAYAIPQWRWNLGATYRIGDFTGHVQGRYVGGGKYDHQLEGLIDDNTVSSAFYVDLSAQYTLSNLGGIQVYGSVNNLFDKDPPVDPSSFFEPIATNPALYDVIGRYFTLGVRYSFK